MVLLGAPAGAGADSGFAVRAKPGGLDFIGDTVRAKVPKEISLPDVEESVTLTDGEAELDIHAVELTPHDGALEVFVSLDLHVSAHLDAGFTECDLDVFARPVDLGATLALSNHPEDGIRADALDLDIGLTTDAFDLDSRNCVVGDLAEAVLEAVEGWALDKATELLRDLASEEILPRLQEAIEEFTSLELETAGLELAADIESLDLDPSIGMTVLADGQITWAGEPHPDLPDLAVPTTEAPIGPALPDDYGPGDFAIAASDDRVTQALYEAWRGGVFRELLGGVSPTVDLDAAGLAQKLGLPPGTTVSVGIDLAAPPMVGFGRGPDATGVRIHLVNLEVAADIEAPGAATSTIHATVAGTLHARVAIDPGAGALRIEPTDLSIHGLELDAGSQSLDVDPARLREFVRAVAVPLLSDALAGIPIAPAVNPMSDLFAVARDVTTQGGWLRAAVDIYRPDPNDAENPETELVRPARVVAPAMTRFPVTGSDDTTPPELLRYVVVLDGEVQDAEPAFITQASVSAAEGNHVLEVRSVDLSGREDPTPVVHSFYVDGTPPELSVSDAPESVIHQREAFAAWTASDDYTETGAVETRWELRKVAAGDARGAVVASDDFTSGRLQVQLGDLEEGELYVLEIVARDEAGNVTSSEHGFAVEPGGAGCAAGGTGAAPLFVLLAVAALQIPNRRRSAAAAILSAGIMLSLVPGSAWAQGIGTTLSGPTDGDGAAAFWNPAAMVRSSGTRVEAGSGLSLIRASYTPTDRADGSETFVPKPEPTVGAISDVLHERVRVGFTVGVPQIDGATWSRDDGASDITRWYAVEAKTYHVTFTPAVAYTPAPWIAIGAGVNVVSSQISAELDKDMGKQLNLTAGSTAPDSPFPYGDPAMAAPIDLSASGWSVGAVAGVLVRPHDRVTIGASVHTPTKSYANGSVDVEYPDAMRELVEEAAPAAELPELAGEIEVPLELPLMTFAAVAVEPADGWELRADYRFLNRSDVSDFNIDVTQATSPDVSDTAVVRGYRDRHSFGLRAARALWAGRGAAALRARFEPNTVPETTVAPNNMDFDKLELGVAARFAFTERVGVVGYYSHYFMPERTVDESLHQPLVEPTLDAFNHPAPTGTYRAVSDYVGFMLSVEM